MGISQRQIDEVWRWKAAYDAGKITLESIASRASTYPHTVEDLYKTGRRTRITRDGRKRADAKAKQREQEASVNVRLKPKGITAVPFSDEWWDQNQRSWERFLERYITELKHEHYRNQTP